MTKNPHQQAPNKILFRVREAPSDKIEAMADGIVRAAGGVVWRTNGNNTVEILLVHRPGEGYDDWTFPKGKRDDIDSSEEDCAIREVWEETGYHCQLGHEIARINYIDRKGRPKRVRYWTMIVSGGAESYSNEVDAMMWMSVDRARKKITYERDLLVIECFENYLRSGLTE